MDKRKLIAMVNIIIPIIMFIIWLLNETSENIVHLITFSLFIGWLIPYIVPLLTGIAILNKSHEKLSFTCNLFCILQTIMLIIIIINLYDKNFLIMLIEYIILLILCLSNFILYSIKLNKDSKNAREYNKIEKEKIKNIKKNNNGAIV